MTLGKYPNYGAYAKRAISNYLTVRRRPRSDRPAAVTWFSVALEALLKEEGTQKTWLAEKLDVDPGTISGWLWEGHIPKRKVRNEIEDIMGRPGYFNERDPETGDSPA